MSNKVFTISVGSTPVVNSEFVNSRMFEMRRIHNFFTGLNSRITLNLREIANDTALARFLLHHFPKIPKNKITRGVNMPDKLTEVPFPAYCMAFKVIDEKASDEICYGLDATKGEWANRMFRVQEGDGIVLVRSNVDIDENRRITIWRQLSQDGKITEGLGDEMRHKLDVDPEMAKYFIAGAFGIDELFGTFPLDNSIVDGLHKLHIICTKKGKACQKSKEAFEISERWKEIKGIKEKTAEYNRRLQWKSYSIGWLQKELIFLMGRTRRREKLEAEIAPHMSAMPSSPESLEDYEKAEELYKEMIVIARALVEEEKAIETDEPQPKK